MRIDDLVVQRFPRQDPRGIEPKERERLAIDVEREVLALPEVGGVASPQALKNARAHAPDVGFVHGAELRLVRERRFVQGQQRPVEPLVVKIQLLPQRSPVRGPPAGLDQSLWRGLRERESRAEPLREVECGPSALRVALELSGERDVREVGDDRHQQVQNVSEIRPQGGAVFLQRACVAPESRGKGLVARRFQCVGTMTQREAQ